MTGNAVPSKTQIGLYEKCRRNPGRWMNNGNGWQGVYREKEDGDVYEVYHYGNLIVRMEGGGYAVGELAHSVSDRTGLNSVLYIFGVDDRYRIVDGRMVIDDRVQSAGERLGRIHRMRAERGMRKGNR